MAATACRALAALAAGLPPRRCGALARLLAPRTRAFATWQPPSFDCYALLGVPSSATAEQIKKAYLAKAKAAHPDSGGGAGSSHDDMSKLNLCYEALSRNRSAYDAAKGVGGAGPRASAYAASRDPWWKAKETASEDFSDFSHFGMDWEDLFYGTKRNPRARRQQQPQQPRHETWQQRAEAWRHERAGGSEEQATSGRRRGAQRGRRREAEPSDSEDSDDDDFGYPRRPRWRGAERAERGGERGARGERGRAEQEADAEASARSAGQTASGSRGKREGKTRSRPWEGEGPPKELWLSVPRSGRQASESWDKIAGQFKFLEESFNGHPAYKKAGSRSLYLFWSREFGDWKLAERFEDDGSCVAYAEDAKGRRPPWVSFAPRWHFWEPSSRRFVVRRLRVEACGGASDETGGGEAGAGGPEGEACGGASDETGGGEAGAGGPEGEGEEDDEEVPWARPPWSQWSSADLRRWCERHSISLHDCFDRESLLEKVISAADETCKGSGGSRASRGKHAEGESSDSSDDEDDPWLRRRSRDRGGSRSPGIVRLASRVKTDGSYTRPPLLDRRASVYGNRIERFRGAEADVLPWLYNMGDKSRLYAVYFERELGYSMVWKKGKYWGRPSARSGARRGNHW